MYFFARSPLGVHLRRVRRSTFRGEVVRQPRQCPLQVAYYVIQPPPIPSLSLSLCHLLSSAVELFGISKECHLSCTPDDAGTFFRCTTNGVPSFFGLLPLNLVPRLHVFHGGDQSNTGPPPLGVNVICVPLWPLPIRLSTRQCACTLRCTSHGTCLRRVPP
jgi:hypothetical protein